MSKQKNQPRYEAIEILRTAGWSYRRIAEAFQLSPPRIVHITQATAKSKKHGNNLL